MKTIKIGPPMGDAVNAPHSALLENNLSDRATELVDTLSAEQAYSVGAAVGSLLKDRVSIEPALSLTVTVAEFVKRGQAAQQAVDAILSAERQSENPESG